MSAIMRRIVTLLGILASLLVFSAPVAAQTDEEQVLAVIERLFEGMRTADTLLVASLFHPEARLVAIDTRAGRREERVVTLESFVAAVAGSERQWNERIWDHEFRIDADLAMVWAKYDFHIGDRFSHCGVDAFHLVRTESEWKIISILYTRRSDDCESPPGG
jgi:hypothetical protein